MTIRLLIKLSILFLLLAAGCGESISVDELRRTGEQAFVDQDYVKARQCFLKALNKEPSDRDLLYFAGMCYKRDFVYDSALIYLRRADILYPDDREINSQIYEVAIALEEWEDAIHAVNILAKTGDGFEKWHGKLSELWTLRGWPINGLFWARKAMESDPDNPAWYMQAANQGALCDSLELSIAILDSAIERFGPSDRFIANKATFLTSMGRFEEAEILMRNLVTEDTSIVAHRLNLANILATQDDRSKKEEALSIYRAVQPLLPTTIPIDSVIIDLETELNQQTSQPDTGQ